jgi:stalled ribosome rescue protein Dom34
VKGGGWAHLNQQEHVEELWKQNQQELSAEVDRLVRDVRPRLLIVAGDIKAAGLLLDALAPASREIAVELQTNVRSGGTDDSLLETFVGKQLTELERRQRAEAIDLLRTRVAQERAAGDVGVRGVTEALRQAQVDTLFVDDAALQGETLLALDDVPWVARAAEDAGPAGIVGEVPAVEALLRAALLTDARILTASHLDTGAGAAALLRWPVDVTANA